jgi:hypothetical protein
MRNLGRALTLALVIALGAGCSSSHTSALAPSRSTIPDLASSTTSTTTAPVTPKQAATALASRMVGQAVLPPGSTGSDVPLPSLLRGPFQTPSGGNVVPANRVWTVDAAPSAVVAFLKTHKPPGFEENGVGSSSSPAGQAQYVIERLHVLPPNVSNAGLEIGVGAGAPGTSLVNVVGVVQWTPLRPANELVPAADHVVIVSVVQIYQPAKPVVGRVVVSDPVKVAQITRRFDGLRVAPPGQVFHCVAVRTNAVAYRIAFATTAAATPDLIATDAICSSIEVTAGGHRSASLSDFDGAFGLAIAHALGQSTLKFQ